MENKTHDEMNLWHCGKAGWKSCVIRWVLGIVILIIVFSLGFSLGKFSGYLKAGYGYYGMGSYGSPMMGGYYRNNMMYPTNGYYGMGPWMMGGYYQGQNSQPQTLPPTLR